MKTQFDLTLEDLYKLTLSQRPIIRKDYNLSRIQRLLQLMNNPENQFQTIHIAGTSGKGSTSTILSNLINDQGYKVGLFTSPHIINIRERIQLNNEYISESDFIKIYKILKPLICEINAKEIQQVTFFEATTAMAFYYFAMHKVNYAVIETGLGGIVDPTNTVTNKDKISIITKIGFDHTDILGKTLPLIAKQKAGIIHNNNICISAAQKPQVITVLKNKCALHNAPLVLIGKEVKYSINMDSSFNYSYTNEHLYDLKLNLLGEYQKENCSLALTALYILSKRYNFSIDKEKLINTLDNLFFLGRFNEVIINNNKIIIDGAHNPQKMAAFIKSVKKYHKNKKFNIILAFKKGKDYSNILKYITPIANKIYVSNFSINTQGFKIESESEGKISQILNKLDFFDIEIITPEEIKNLINSEKSDFIITGSLYFIADQINNYKLIDNKHK